MQFKQKYNNYNKIIIYYKDSFSVNDQYIEELKSLTENKDNLIKIIFKDCDISSKQWYKLDEVIQLNSNLIIEEYISKNNSIQFVRGNFTENFYLEKQHNIPTYTKFTISNSTIKKDQASEIIEIISGFPKKILFEVDQSLINLKEMTYLNSIFSKLEDKISEIMFTNCTLSEAIVSNLINNSGNIRINYKNCKTFSLANSNQVQSSNNHLEGQSNPINKQNFQSNNKENIENYSQSNNYDKDRLRNILKERIEKRAQKTSKIDNSELII